jgi:ubiquinol-cytochrome c reductase cytochrome c1 subunit
MKKLISLCLLLFPLMAFSAGGGVHLDHANVDLGDKPSLQRGAKLFVNYCLSCHSAAYARFNGTAKDIGIPEDVMLKNLMFASDKIGSYMKIAMDKDDAKKWFGVTPPDLSVISRSRGSDWIYTFLNSFYLDSSKASGVNNTVFKDTAMPHVLWELQGWQRPVYTEEDHGEGDKEAAKVLSGLQLVAAGKLNEEDYQQATRDLTNFLTYLGEPAQLIRKKVGFWVILFLLVLLIPAYKLKKEYWKDVK